MRIKNVDLEYYTLISVAIMVIIVTIAHMIGVLEIEKIQKSIPQCTIVLLCFFSGFIAIEIRKRFSELSKSVEIIKSALTERNLNQIKLIKNDIDDTLLKIFSDKFNEIETFYHDAILKKTVSIDEIERYVYYYAIAMKNSHSKKIISTSVADKNYLWSPETKLTTIEKATDEYIKNGGKVVRIFFVDEENLDDLDTKSILDKQKRLGVEVYFIPSKDVPTRLKKLFFATDDCSVGAEGKIDKNKQLIEIEFTSDKTSLEKYLDYFKQLHEISSLKKYE